MLVKEEEQGLNHSPQLLFFSGNISLQKQVIILIRKIILIGLRLILLLSNFCSTYN